MQGELSRLRGFLASYGLEKHFQRITTMPDSVANAPEYGALWQLLENRIITTAQAKEILQGMIQETLFDLLSLRQGYFIFEMGAPLTPQLVTLRVMPIVATTLQRRHFKAHFQQARLKP